MAHREAQTQTTAVQVAVRVRPFSEKDRAIPRFSNMSESDVLRIQNSSVYVAPHSKTFTFDYVFGPNSAQDEIFVTLADPLIHKFIDGYNVTILAYGQTSSGKTYTMGTAQHGESYDMQEEGIIPRAMSLLFDTLQRMNIPQFRDTRSKLERKFRPLSVPAAIEDVKRNKNSIKVSFVEIYNEDLVDLLNPAPPSERPPVTIREDTKGQIYWSGVRELPVESTDDVLNFLEQGTQNRATGATDMNEKSSRSHAIFSVTLRQEKWVPTNGSPSSSILRSPSPSVSGNRSNGLRRPESSAGFRTSDMGGEEGEWVITHSKFHFVDLAGSERLKRTAAEGDRRKEGININGGLLALGNVISALGDPSKKSTHVPYRDSKLTRLLQDSLGGNATTLMIACVSPAEYNLVETVNTLMYANRARNIRNRSEKNEFEEWQTNDNAEFLRGVILKLKTELGALKANSFAPSTLVKDSTMSSPSLISDGTSSLSTSPDLEQIFLDQRNEIMNLQHLIEKLEGELAVTQERERVAEEQLQHMWNNDSGPRSQDIEKLKQEVDFEHLVEPVIEEYEKSISVLESQLAMARAALHHSDIGFEEQSARITHQEQLNENQSHIINELKSRISKITEREQSNDLYIEELELKLSKATQDSIRDQEALNDLKTKLSKLTETEDSTEKYITTLEQRLANVEKEKETLMNMLESLEVAMAAKDSALEAMKIRAEQAERGDDKKMLLHELDDVLQRHQDLESAHQELRLKYEVLEKKVNVSVNEDQSSKEKLPNGDGELDVDGPRNHKRLSRSFQQEMSDHQQATDVVEKTKEIEHLKTHITNLQLDLTSLKQQNTTTLEKLDASVRANENAATQIETLQKTVQEHKARAAEIAEMAPEADSEPAIDLQKEIEQELGSSKLREQSLKRELEDLQQQMQLKDTKLTMRDNDCSQLQHSLETAQQRLQAAEQTISESQTKEQDLANGFETERKLLQKSTDHLESEIEMLKIERNSLLAQITEHEAISQKSGANDVDNSPSTVAKAVNGVNEADHVSSDSNQSLVGELEVARSDVAKLSMSLDDLYAKYNELQDKLTLKEAKLLEAQESSSKSKDEIELLKKERSTLEQELSDMQKSLQHRTDSNKSQSDNQNVVIELKLAQEQLDLSSQTILQLQKELSDTVASSALLAEQITKEKVAEHDQVKQSYDAFPEYQKLLAELNDSKANHNSTKESLKLLQQQLEDSMDNNSKLTEQLTQIHEAAATTSSTVNYEEEVMELRSKLQSSEQEMETVNARILDIQKQHDETTANLNDANQKIMEMLEVKEKVPSTTQVQNGHSQFAKEMQEKEEELAKSFEKSKLLETQLDGLANSHTSITAQLSVLTATLMTSEANTESLQKSLDLKTNEHSDAVNRIQILQKEMEEMTSSLKDDLTSKHDTLDQKLVELQAKHDALQDKYNSAIDHHRSIVEEHEQSSLGARASVDEQMTLLEKTRSEKETVEQLLKEQMKHSESLQNSINELTKSLNESRIDNAAIEQKFEIQKAQTSEAQLALERQLTITADLEAKLNELQLSLEQIEAETAEASAAMQSNQIEREEEVELYQNAIMELETKLQNVSQANVKELQTASDRHGEGEKELAKIKAEIAERDMFIAELEASICKMEEELKISQTRLQENSNTNIKLQETVNLQADEIERLKLDLEITQQEVKEKNNDQLQSLDRQLKALQDETEEYNTLIEEMDTHLQIKSNEVEEIIAELASAEAEKVQQQAKIEELERQLADTSRQSLVIKHDKANVEDDSLIESQLQEAKAELQQVSKEKDDLLGKIERLTVDKSQLQSKLSAVENQVEAQSLKLSKEVADLRNEVDSLINKNEELEKQVAQPPNKRSSRAFAATRDSPSSIISPPQTPRISSPSPDALQNKLKLHESTIAQQASLIKSLEDRVQQSVSQRTSLDDSSSHPNTSAPNMRKSTSSTHLPPPPSEPLPPLPKASTLTKTTSISSTRSGSAPEEMTNNSLISTTEQYEKTIKSLQKKLDAGEADVKAHLEVITKLEQQLFRAENALKEARKRVALSPTRTNSTTDNGELDKMKEQLSAISIQLTEQQEQSAEEVKKLQDEIEATKKAKEKAEKARVILENRIDQLMSKKSKFMCF